ncbi:hypothetical protein D3C78_1770830 [compost metagenome]
MSGEINLHIAAGQLSASLVTIAEFIAEAVAAMPALQIVYALEAVVVEQQHRNFPALLQACNQLGVKHQVAPIPNHCIYVAL